MLGIPDKKASNFYDFLDEWMLGTEPLISSGAFECESAQKFSNALLKEVVEKYNCCVDQETYIYNCIYDGISIGKLKKWKCVVSKLDIKSHNQNAQLFAEQPNKQALMKNACFMHERSNLYRRERERPMSWSLKGL